MHVLVLAPMPSELKPVVKAFGLDKAASKRRHAGAIGDVRVTATMTGIGTVTAAEVTERELADGDIDHVIVVGIAGGLDDQVQIGDLIFPEFVIDGASGAEYHPVALGDQILKGGLHTSDDFILDRERLAPLAARGVIALDMETAAVGAVCEAKNIAWSVFRSISDRVSDGMVTAEVAGLAKPDGSPDVKAVAKFLARHPTKAAELARIAKDANAAATAAANAAASAVRAGFSRAG